MATLELLALVAEQQPLAVVVDDFQWIDGGSAVAILFAARRLVDDPVALLLAARSGWPIHADDLPTMTLTGLDDDSARSLLRSHGIAMTGPAVAQLVARTGGNPLALLEIAPTLDLAERAGGPDATHHLPLGEQVQAALLDRTRSLDDAALAALRAGRDRARRGAGSHPLGHGVARPRR